MSGSFTPSLSLPVLAAALPLMRPHQAVVSYLLFVNDLNFHPLVVVQKAITLHNIWSYVCRSVT